jgi:hypothetical protein
MKVAYLLFLLLMCLFGCQLQIDNQAPPSPYGGLGIDDAFYTQVMTFNAEWGHIVTNTDIVFVDTLGGNEQYTEEGECDMPSVGAYQRVIKIARDSWNVNPDPNFREALILHELGHCALDRGHRNDLDADGCAVSIMNAVINNVLVCYKTNRGALIGELFGR